LVDRKNEEYERLMLVNLYHQKMTIHLQLYFVELPELGIVIRKIKFPSDDKSKSPECHPVPGEERVMA
jgi:hypothetical protein